MAFFGPGLPGGTSWLNMNSGILIIRPKEASVVWLAEESQRETEP